MTEEMTTEQIEPQDQFHWFGVSLSVLNAYLNGLK